MVLESNTLDLLFVKDGEQGTDGKMLYTWIKYAKDDKGTDMTDDPQSAVYIGISYNNESNIESDDPTQYAWTKIQGADGKKGEDAYTIVLENENISFATDENRNPLSEQAYTSRITVMKGATPVTDFGIGDIAKTQGIAIAKGDDGISISVVNGNALPADSGEITVPISVGGTVFKKVLTWTCAKKGEQGVKGDKGDRGEQGLKGIQGDKGEQGIQGEKGSDGRNNATVYLYQRSDSTPSKPTNALTYTFATSAISGTIDNGWSINIPTGASPLYVTVASVSSKSASVSIAASSWSAPVVLASNGKTGSDGKAGLNVATIYLYQRNTSKPSKPSASVTYTFSTGVASGLNNGWSQKIPDGTNPLYVTLATASSNTATDTILSSEWSDVVVMAQNGEDGQDGISPKVSLSKTGDTTTISIVDATGTHTQTVKDGTNGTPGAAGKDGKTSYFHVKYSNDGGKTFTGNSGEDTGIYMGSYTDYTEADSTDVKKYNWVKVKGDKGDTGQKGQDGTSVKITSKSVTYQTSTSGTTAPTGTWSTTVPTVNNGQYLWTKTTVQYSDGNKTEAYSVSYKGTNGQNGTSITVSKNEVTYQVSTSGTTTPTGTWSTTMPSCDQGQYLWIKTYVKYSDGKETTSYSVSYKGVDGNDGADGDSFAWNLLSHSSMVGEKIVCDYIELCNSVTMWKYTDEGYHLVTPSSGNANNGIGIKFDNYKDLGIDDEESITFSCDIKGSSGSNPNIAIHISDDLWYGNGVVTKYIKFTPTNNWQRFSVSITTPSNLTKRHIWLAIHGNLQSDLYIKNLKLEKGSTPTPWSPSQSDIEGADAKSITITPSAQIFKSTDGGNTFAPNQITITPTLQGDITFGKWQYSIDGGVSFADVVSGQSGLTISNNVLTVSKDSSLYSDAVTMVTFRAVASDSSFYDTCSIAKLYDVTDIEIGGVNLIKNSNFADGINKWETIGITCTIEADSTYGHHIKFSSSIVGDSNHRLIASASDNFNHVKNTTYTLSFYAKTSANTQVQSNVAGGANPCNYSLTTSWQRYTTTYKASAAGSLTFWAVEANKDIYLANIKLERGNKPTDYTVSPEDVQTAILSTKNSIENVSSKVDTNTKSIQDKVSKTTYERELTLVKGDLSKANDGLNKWRYEIYPKSLFASEDQSKSTIDIFVRNLNLVPSQTVLLDDTNLSTGMNYGDQHIAYALTFVKMSAKKDVTTKMFNDNGASLYVNGGLISSRGGDLVGTDVTFTLMQGWNCLEVVVNEQTAGEGFRFSTTLSKLSECQMMNCYYGTPVARQSRITNQLVDVTKNLTGVTSTVQDVMTAVGNSGNITEFKNNYSKWKQSVDGIESRVGSTYVTNEKFDGLEIGGRNLLTKDDCNMSKWQNLYPAHCKITSNDYSNHIDYVPTGGEWEIIYKKISVTKGQKYILSFDYKVNKAYNYLSGQKYGVYLSTSVPTNAAPTNIITDGQYVIENTITSIKRGVITFTAPIDTLYIVINGGCINDNQTGLSFEFNKWKLEKGNKATDWTPAPEDDEINGQNLVSNLPSNWEQGTVTEGSAVGTTYANTKSSSAGSIRPKELIPVSGNITISTAYSNQSKKPIRHWIAAYDVNKNYLGNNYVSNAWNSFPRTLDMKDAKYIAIMVGYTDSSAITPSDISQICLKIECGTSATPFTLAPEDVNGKIVNVETIANQTAKKFEWIVKGGDKSSSMVLTDDFLNIVANNINLTGKVTFNSFDSAAQKKINDIDTKAGNASTAASTAQASANNAKAAADKAQSSVDRLEIGGRNLVRLGGLSGNGATSFSYDKTTDTYTIVSPVVSTVWGIGAAVKYDDNHKVLIPYGKTYILSFEVKVPQALSINIDINNYAVSGSSWAGNDNDAGSARGQSSYSIPANTWTKVWVRWANTNTKNTNKVDLYDNSSIGLVTKDCTSAVTWQIRHVKGELGNKPTDWTPAPEDVSQDATNKASQALTDAKNYSSNAVNWVTSNGSSTTSLNSMVKKWTDGAVSDTTQINGGWIKANTITASKIALADFTNYSQLTRDTAATYGFAVTDDTDGTWFSTQGIRRDQFISEIFPCNGGESYLIEYDISTNAKGANNSTDTKNYIGVAIGVYGYTGTVGSNGLPNKATNIWYATRVTGSEAAAVTHVKTTITTSTATKQFRIFLQSNGYYFEGTTKIRNLSVRRMYGGTLIVDGSITADKIATDAIKSRNYISSGGTQGSFLNLSDGSFQSPNLSWDANGNLIAKNANLSGEITAKDGTIGKYKITDQWLITGSGSTCTGIGGNQAFWAGAEDSNSAPFRVNYDGSMISTKGKIGDWKIDKMGLYNDFIVTFGVDQSDGTWLETFYTNYSAKTLYKANAFNNIFLGNKICCMDTHTEYTYLNDNSNKGDITYVESVILENGRINLHSSQYSDSRFALIPYDNYGSHLTLSGEAIEFSSYEADGTYSERNVDAKYTYTYISSDTIKTADVYCSNILRTNNLLVYEIISGRDIHLTSSANQIQLNASNQGSIELYGQTPFIDFHYNYSGDDYTSRIIANGSNLLSITGNLWVDVDIHAGSWLYASEVHTSGAVVIASDSESFYWAHGYQIARGTSWGGVCVGDDSQQLRLYGSSIWAAHGISTSDENLKENFTTLDQYEDFYMNLNPIGFNYIGDYDGKKTHFGFGAHKTEDILESEGYDSDKFAVVTHRPLVQEDIEKRFGKDIDVDIETEYGVSYTEFIALNTHMIQKTRRELTKVKQEKADLEARLQAIEAKLGL